MMKSILIIITLTLVSYNITFAQTNNEVLETTNELISRASNIGEIKSSHTLSAFKQLQKYSTTNIEYPEHLIEYGLEGTVVLEVSISSTGKVENLKVIKSLSTAFDDVVLNEMKKCKSVTFLEEDYKGKSKIHLPIRFSLK